MITLDIWEEILYITLNNHLRDMGRNIAELKHHWKICRISLKIWEEIYWSKGHHIRDLGRDAALEIWEEILEVINDWGLCGHWHLRFLIFWLIIDKQICHMPFLTYLLAQTENRYSGLVGNWQNAWIPLKSRDLQYLHRLLVSLLDSNLQIPL